MLLMRDNDINIPDGKLQIVLVYGVHTLFDLDNALKGFIDILEKRYEFNDNRVMRILAEKVIVSRGNEYIEYDIFSMES